MGTLSPHCVAEDVGVGVAVAVADALGVGVAEVDVPPEGVGVGLPEVATEGEVPGEAEGARAAPEGAGLASALASAFATMSITADSPLLIVADSAFGVQVIVFLSVGLSLVTSIFIWDIVESSELPAVATTPPIGTSGLFLSATRSALV